MNKFTKAGIAGAAALAIAAGGGTYALWSDYVVSEGQTAGADQLKLSVAGTTKFDKVNMAPGEAGEHVTEIAARVGGTDIQSAMAWLTFENLENDENGCGGTNAEAADDPNCANANNAGEFSDNALVVINVQDRVDGACTGPTTNLVNKQTLSSLADNPIQVGELANNEAFCIKMLVGLPSTVGNNVMTDQAGFDLNYELKQIGDPSSLG